MPCWLTLLIAVHFLVASPTQNALANLTISPYSIEFIMGAMGGWLIYCRKKFQIPSWTFLSIIITIFFLMPELFSHFYSIKPVGLFKQCIVFGTLFTLLLVSAVKIEENKTFSLPAILVKTGDISYTIYLSHVLIMGAIGRLWERFFQSPKLAWDNLLVFPLTLVIIFVYSSFAYGKIEIPSYRFFLKLFTLKKNNSKGFQSV